MIAFKAQTDQTASDSYTSWHFMNWDGQVLLEAKYVIKDGRIAASWKRPVSGDQRDGSDEPPIPLVIMREALDHYRSQITFRRWKER